MRAPTTSPRTTAATIATADLAVTLEAVWHEPAGASRGVAVVAPGVAVPSRVMAPLADHLAANGWTAVRFDFPGVGDSTLSPRDVPGGMTQWATRDLAAMLDVARERAGDQPVVLVGHSAGAWLLNLTDRAGTVDAVVAIASMSGYWRGLKRDERGRMVFAMFVAIPLFSHLLGYLPGAVALRQDAPGGAMLEWARWCRRPGFFRDARDVEVHADAITAPVHVLLPLDDAWASEASTRDLWDRLPNARVEYTFVDPADHGGRAIGHLGLLRDRFADTVWRDVTDWLDEQATRTTG